MKTRIDRTQDVETLRPRPLKVMLCDRDAAAIALEAARNGITVGELVSGFINDLIGGAQSNGSDERRLASEYVDRCCYDLWSESTFLYSLIESGFINEIVDNLEFIAEYGDDPDAADEVEEAKAEINVYYESYQETFKDKAESLSDGLQAVNRYIKDLTRLQSDVDPFIAYLNSVYASLKAENEKSPGSADDKIKLLRAVRDSYKQIKESEG